MRASCFGLLCFVVACRSESGFAAPPGGEGRSKALRCGEGACPSVDAELAARCAEAGTTVTLTDVGGYTVLRAQTDPRSYVYTSFTLVYAADGTLVGRDIFVNEYARHEREGVAPRGEPRNQRDGCVGRRSAPGPASDVEGPNEE
jgi:hypothetical protein